MSARRFNKSTIQDVARHAGVSKTTVSYFVGGREEVCSPETAQRIRAAVSALHYVPSRATRGLRERATHTIGVCLASPFDKGIGWGASFQEQVWRGIGRVADEKTYRLLHYPEAVRLGADCDAFLDGSIDGLIYRPVNDRRLETLAAAGLPVVQVTRARDFSPGCGSAYANEADTAGLALSHLWAQGHRRIAHLAGPLETCRVQEAPGKERTVHADGIALGRRDAYVEWMRANNVYDPALLAFGRSWNGDLARIADAVAAWRRLDDPPTAVFCANDNLAMAVMTAAHGLGWRVPQALSVVGVDNTAHSATSDPPLTTVDVSLENIGAEATRALLRLMDGDLVEQCRVAVPVTNLVVRASTAPPPAGRHI